MKKASQPGFYDLAERATKLTEMGDPLVGLNTHIDWEAFRSELNKVHDKTRKSNAGAKPIDVVLMFKVLVLQQLNALIKQDALPVPSRVIISPSVAGHCLEPVS